MIFADNGDIFPKVDSSKKKKTLLVSIHKTKIQLKTLHKLLPELSLDVNVLSTKKKGSILDSQLHETPKKRANEQRPSPKNSLQTPFFSLLLVV